jgi:hypothetical protein
MYMNIHISQCVCVCVCVVWIYQCYIYCLGEFIVESLQYNLLAMSGKISINLKNSN